MSDPRPEDRAERPLVGGRLLAEITNRIVAFMREHYGRGPIKAKTYVLDNLIVCVLSDGFAAIERTMMQGGEPDRVLDMRRDFQRMMKARYTEMIEQLTGRKVLAFLSQAHVEPDLTIEIFLMDGPIADPVHSSSSTHHRAAPGTTTTSGTVVRAWNWEAMRLSAISGWTNSRCCLLGSRSRSMIPRRASSVGGALGGRRRGSPPKQTLEVGFT